MKVQIYENNSNRIIRTQGVRVDLRNLIVHLNDSGDSESIKPLVLAQFDKEPNIGNALEVVNCFGGSPFFDHAAILEFLDEKSWNS